MLFTELSAAKLKQQPTIELKEQPIEDMILVSADKLLVSFHEQKKLMLLESESGKMVSEIALQDEPMLICMTGNHHAAVTSKNSKINFIQVSANQLKLESSMKVGVAVFGIAVHQQNMVMSYGSYWMADGEPGVKIISKDGTEIHNLDNTTTGREVFNAPRWITTTSDGSIYVTDWGTHKITRLDSSLTILQTFSGDMLEFPLGIISLNNKQLLVCSGDTDSIVLIRPSTNSMTVLLEKQLGIERPASICFCKVQKKLYISPSQGNSVVVYRLL